ncbi:1-phosphofructokinase family hexose kinase [Nocardia sp. NBC_00565]|uniref:1-phosphofructokinase family hexose kinase n=1 Tax=Nocardia sp. NBC_00565 TaxID=2975993 RepID=UPI002E7FD958|nr:1-phosphofructokinase family hexose kinase [Nocardia sp. NBC_00565]WUC04872.1 1-phosphofructokinase family hexose kinase [Nocardia sp. NBC_00565]
MIVTLTANPSIDRTVSLPEPLRRGAVHRALSVSNHPGGKGVNVSRVVAAAGADTVAVLPGNSGDPLPRALAEAGIDYRIVPAPGAARVNLTLAEADGTTTKINEPGAPLTAECLGALADLLCELAPAASWVVLSGSLPPAVPADWYVELVRRLRGVRVAVDTSDAPLRALAREFDTAAPELIKPNAEELAQLGGGDPAALEDPVAAAHAATALVDRGVGAVLATLGAAGAVLVTADGAWHAAAPAITPRSTVGAGDAALAGYLLADSAGAAPAERLRRAVAYGSAAAGLPGTGLPGPHHTDPDAVTVTALDLLPHR